MAAVLIDPETQEPVSTEVPKAEPPKDELYDEVEDTEEVVASTEAEEEELPEKYRGKTVAEIARMHQEAERYIGKQGNEVGELRAAFDEFVQTSVKAKDEPQAPTEEVDFFLDPAAAVERAISNHPKLKEAEAVTAEMAKERSLSKLKSDFPDMNKTLQDPAFAKWVQASKIRQQLYARADRSYDYDAAAELFNNFAERRAVVEQTVQVEKQHTANEVAKASAGSNRSNPDARRTKKIYRRSDIIKLMKTDPDRYEAIQPDLMKAYAEGRVK